MGLFSFIRKSSAAAGSSTAQPATPQSPTTPSPTDPYRDSSANLIYNLLFCDDLNLYKAKTKAPFTYPFDILFSENSAVSDLQKIVADSDSDPRVKVLAYNRLLAGGHKPEKKELLAVIVEVGLDGGLDVLASFEDGTARYINQTGKILIWETTDKPSKELTDKLFSEGRQVIDQIGPWDKPRRPCPGKGAVRVTFLVSDGLYFGEGPMNILFRDPLAAPALNTAAELMKYITEKALEKNK